MKKKLFLLLAFVLVTVSFASGVFAAGTVTAIKAYLNKSLVIKVDGETLQPVEADGSRIYPVVYNGRTFVPAKAVAEALGATVEYDGTGNGLVTITSGSVDGNAGMPVKDGDSSGSVSTPPADETPTPTPTKVPTAPAATTATGSLASPVPMNQKLTWSSTYTYKDTSYSGTYSATVKSAKKITAAGIKDLGIRISDDDATKFDFMLVTLAWEVKNAKYISAPSDMPYMSLSSFSPEIFGSESSDGKKTIIGGTDYGFSASIKEKVRAATDLRKLYVGDSASFSAEGQVILPLTKNVTNYLVIQDSGLRVTTDYDKSKLRFKLN